MIWFVIPHRPIRAPTTHEMAQSTTFNLPAPPDANTPDGMEFAGWLVAGPTGLSSFETNDDEDLLTAGTSYTVNENVSFTARYRYIDVILADNANNGEVLSTYDGMTAHSVTLSGRTLYKDGSWNTLCLPFNVSAEQMAANKDFAGATLMELDTEEGTYDHITGFENGTLYLNFKSANSIEAGKPYIIKWAAGSNITSPVFSNVAISNTLAEVESVDGSCTFVGTYSLQDYNEEERSILFLGGGDNVYYPQPDSNNPVFIGSCRAYFRLNGIMAGDPNAGIRGFALNFKDENATGILEGTTDYKDMKDDAWFSIEGVQLQGKPAVRGIYINNGKKIVIK